MADAPIRILQIVKTMDAGGLETLIMNWYRQIDRTKVQFDFLVHTDKECFYDDEIRSLGGMIHRVPDYASIHHMRYRRKLKEFFRQHRQYRVVHAHLITCSVWALRQAARAGVPVRISHSHTAFPTFNLARLPIRVYGRIWSNRYPTHRFACSKAAGVWLFGARDDVRVVPNAVDAARFRFNAERRASLREELNLDGKLVVGHVGRFQSVKNHAFLIDIFERVHRLRNDSALMLVGDGGLRDEIAGKVKEKGLTDCVIFTGVRDDVNDLMQAMDVFLFPSLFEGLPVTLVEAQAAGLPVVASDAITDEVAITELVEFMSLTESPEVWAERVLQAAAKHERGDRSREVAEAGYDSREGAARLQGFYLEQQSEADENPRAKGI